MGVRVSPIRGVSTNSSLRSSPRINAPPNRPPPPFFLPPISDVRKEPKNARSEEERKKKEKNKGRRTTKLGKMGKQTVSYCHITKGEKKRAHAVF